jgi:anti-sigma factor RsiW
MHNVIQDGLEDYLVGRTPREFQSHLDRCSECAEEVRAMRELSGMFSILQAGEPQAAAPGFYQRLSRRIESREPKPLFGIFLPDPAFLRRVAFASLMLLAILGSYLVSREATYTQPRRPEVMMAEHDPSMAHDADSERPAMLVTLAAYRH